MNRFLLLCAMMISQCFQASAQCAEQNEPKVLLVGDSWAFFMGVDQTINNVFRKWGFSNYRFITNGVIAENGAETDDFLKPEKQAMIDSLLKANPSIKAVHLSIGGNDVLGDWKVSFSQGKTDTLKAQVEQRLLQIIDFIKGVRPDVQVFWSGYMYPNFEEVIQTSFLGSNHPFYSTWQKMEFPTFLQLNTLLNEFSTEVEAYAATDPRVDFVNATGLMQYTYGQNTALGVPPSGTYPAFSQPLPFGDPSYPSPRNSMRDYLLTKDCFHLSPKGYSDMIEYHTQKFYHKFLMDDLYLLTQAGASGTVTSHDNTADSLVMGEVFGEQFATVLSFDTRGMADTTLSKASIFLRRKSLEGSNPIGNNLVLKIKNGTFGASASIEAADFSDAGNGSANPCLFGSNGGNGHWIRLDIPVSLFPFISRNDITQFTLLSAPNFTGGRVVFNDASEPDFAPVLNLKYGPTPSSIAEPAQAKAYHVYPNPANALINIETQTQSIEYVEIFNLVGERVMKVFNTAEIDVAALPAGIYLMHIHANTETGRARFVKD